MWSCQVRQTEEEEVMSEKYMRGVVAAGNGGVDLVRELHYP